MKAKTVKGKSTEEIKAALEQCIADGFAPTLAIVFISVKQDRNAVFEILSRQKIDYFGATSSGEFIEEHESEGATVIMLLDLSKDEYCIVFEALPVRQAGTGERLLSEAAERLAKTALRKFNKPAFILCSTLISATGQMMQGETLIESIVDITGPEVNIFGGMAGDDITFTGTYVFTNGQSTDYGMVALILDEEKIELKGVAISGWKPIGISRIVTKSEDNLIYTIDGKPALETYLRFLGEDISSADDQVNFFESVGVHYPFQVERPNREPKMCNPIGYDKEKKALVCESDVPQGSKFRFSTPPDFDIVESVVASAKELKKDADSDADAVLIFSCAGRLSALGPMAQQENNGLAEVWKAPMAGFYTYGEFGRAVNGRHEFHSTTNSWVVLKEKNPKP